MTASGKALLGSGSGAARGEEGGAVMVEFLIAYLPVLVAFLMFWQLGELLVAQMIVERASSAAGRAAVVVIPDDPAFYDGQLNGSFDGERKREIRFAAGMMLAASPHLSENFTVDVQNVPSGDDQVQELTVGVEAEFRCKRLTWVCGVDGRTVLSAASQHTYHGASYEYAPTDLTNIQSNSNSNASSPGCSASDTPNAGNKGSPGGKGNDGAGGKGNNGAGGKGNDGAGGNGSAKGGGKCKSGTADPDGLCPDKTCADTGKKPLASADPNWPCDPACPAGQTRSATGCKPGTGCPSSDGGGVVVDALNAGGQGTGSGRPSSTPGSGPACPWKPPPKCPPDQKLDTKTKTCAALTDAPDGGACTQAKKNAGKCGDAGARDAGARDAGCEADGGKGCDPLYERNALCPKDKPFKTTKGDAPGKCCSSASNKNSCDCSAQVRLNGQTLQGSFTSSNPQFDIPIDLDFTAMGTSCSADKCGAGPAGIDVGDANAYLQNQYRIDQFKSLCDTKGLKGGKYINNGIQKTGTYKDMIKKAKELNDPGLEASVVSWAKATNAYCKLISDHLDAEGNATPQSLHLEDIPGIKNAENQVLAKWNSVDGEVNKVGTGKLGTATNGYHTEVKVINTLQELSSQGTTSLAKGGTLDVTGTQSPCKECDKDLKALSGLGINVRYCFQSLYAGSPAQTDPQAKKTFLQNPGAGTLSSNVAAKGCVEYSSGNATRYTFGGGGLKLCAPGEK